MTEELARVPLEPTGDEPLAQIDAVVDPLSLTEEAATLYIESGLATKPWTATRKDGIETFTSTDNIDYVRARPDEDADVIVGFARLRGMTPLRLVRADE